GAVALIYEPVQPRNTWTTGCIIKLQESDGGAIRRAQVRPPNILIIRRPVNLLIPLELRESEEQETSDTRGNIKDR
ncbi:hypothetical protein Angca_000983, partial [Angiostrongylus cantonensis]